MKYLEHRRRYIDYQQAQDDLNAILDEWIFAFQKVMPKISYGDKVQGSHSNKTEEYVIEVESKHFRERAKEATEIMQQKGVLLAIKEAELRKSHNIYDLIYTCKFVDGMKPKDIYRKLDLMGMNYSTSQIYEITKKIKAQINL